MNHISIIYDVQLENIIIQHDFINLNLLLFYNIS